MKKCCKCDNPRRNKTSTYCKSCHNEYQKAFYKKNPRSISESSKRNHDRIREFVKESKNIPCVDCKIKYPYYVMDFDHVRGDKKFILAVAASKYRSIKSIQEEIDKCEVVCSNCHRERTFNRKLNPLV